MKLDALRVFVDQRLSAATDDIFRCFAETISEYERDVFRLKQEVVFHRKLLETAGHAPTEEGQLVKQGKGGASGPGDTDVKFLLSPDWPRETPETDQSLPPTQIETYGEEAGPQCTEDYQEAFGVKQEVVEGHVMLDSSGREEERQPKGRSFHLHVKQEEGGASGSEEFPPSPDWLIGTKTDEGACLSAQSHTDSDTFGAPAHHEVQSSAEDSEDPGDPDTETPEGSRTPEGLKLLECGGCGREFNSVRTLRAHIGRKSVQDLSRVSCGYRRQRAPSRRPAKSFSCLVCANSFYTRGLLVRHAENHCKDPESRCGVCGGRPDSTETLRDHLRGHKELGSTCDVCGRKCSSIGKMEVHKRVHTGEKPFRCSFCGRDFSRKGSLERHVKVHTGDRPHPCGLCRSTYTRREYLLHHLRTGHPEWQLQPEAAARLRTKSLLSKSKP